MRVRDKRKQQRELKTKHADKTKSSTSDADAKQTPPSKAKTTSLPAAEKVAFDNRIKRKNVLALNEKVAALREYDRQPVYKHVGRIFNCSPDQIKRIVQQKEEILRAWEQRTRRCADARTQEMKVVRVSMLGQAVYDWIRRMMYYKDFIISDGLIQKMALQFKSSMGLNKFFPHQEWCDKFRLIYNIKCNDTKFLKIGYTQSYSVQINDIVKDVLHEEGASAVQHAQQEEHEEQFSLASIEADEDEPDVDIDGGGESSDEEDIKPNIKELNLQRVLPQLVRLPQVPTGTSQKVLLATPILPPGAAQTMTIIPLATLAQSIKPTSALQKSSMPPPKVDIKTEIKTEPEAETVTEPEPEPEPEPEQEPEVCIKQELDSDTELMDEEDDCNGGRSSVRSLAEILAVEDEQQYIQQMRQRKRSPSPELPTLSPLSKAPCSSVAIKRARPINDDNNNGDTISCAEARKYLKLLEEFALARENYRLIALITRADEVMRELADN